MCEMAVWRLPVNTIADAHPMKPKNEANLSSSLAITVVALAYALEYKRCIMPAMGVGVGV